MTTHHIGVITELLKSCVFCTMLIFLHYPAVFS